MFISISTQLTVNTSSNSMEEEEKSNFTAKHQHTFYCHKFSTRPMVKQTKQQFKTNRNKTKQKTTMKQNEDKKNYLHQIDIRSLFKSGETSQQGQVNGVNSS